MKKIILLSAMILTACAPSPEKQKEIAIFTCNILSEIKKTDGVARLKEINLARNKLKGDTFLLSDDIIQESLNHGLCKELVLNDPNYGQLLEESKGQFASILEGIWFHMPNEDDNFSYYFISAEFEGQKLIISKFDEDKDFTQRKTQFFFDYKKNNESNVDIFGNKNIENFVVKINEDSNSLEFFSPELSNTEHELVFKKAPKHSKDVINGKWLEHLEGEYESYWLITMNNSEIIYDIMDLNHTKKTYSKSLDTCDLVFSNGFEFTEKCGDNDDFTFFIVEGDKNSRRIVSNGFFSEEKKVEANYILPKPPADYSKE